MLRHLLCLKVQSFFKHNSLTNPSYSFPKVAEAPTPTDHICPFSNQLWYYGQMSRNKCDWLLQEHGIDGNFLVRDSESKVCKVMFATINTRKLGAGTPSSWLQNISLFKGFINKT